MCADNSVIESRESQSRICLLGCAVSHSTHSLNFYKTIIPSTEQQAEKHLQMLGEVEETLIPEPRNPIHLEPKEFPETKAFPALWGQIPIRNVHLKKKKRKKCTLFKNFLVDLGGPLSKEFIHMSVVIRALMMTLL